jgi:hypothetical protein
MAASLYAPDLTVAQVLEHAAPGIAAVFISHKTACVGCSLAGFCTLAEVAGIYEIPLQELLGQLARAAESNPQP